MGNKSSLNNQEELSQKEALRLQKIYPKLTLRDI